MCYCALTILTPTQWHVMFICDTAISLFSHQPMTCYVYMCYCAITILTPTQWHVMCICVTALSLFSHRHNDMLCLYVLLRSLIILTPTNDMLCLYVLLRSLIILTPTQWHVMFICVTALSLFSHQHNDTLCLYVLLRSHYSHTNTMTRYVYMCYCALSLFSHQHNDTLCLYVLLRSHYSHTNTMTYKFFLSVTVLYSHTYSHTDICDPPPQNESQCDRWPFSCFFFFFFFFFCIPQLYLWGSPTFWVRFLRMWPFFNPTIKVVTFHLRGWCVLGVFLLPPFTRLGHERQDLLSPCAAFIFSESNFYAIYNGENHFQIRGLVAELHDFEFGGTTFGTFEKNLL